MPPDEEERKIKMSNTQIQVLKDWFERVDSDKTGNITTIQLQVIMIPMFYYYYNYFLF